MSNASALATRNAKAGPNRAMTRIRASSGSSRSPDSRWSIPDMVVSRGPMGAAYSSSNARVGSICRSEEHKSELQSLMRISYAVFCLHNKQPRIIHHNIYLYIIVHYIHQLTIYSIY